MDKDKCCNRGIPRDKSRSDKPAKTSNIFDQYRSGRIPCGPLPVAGETLPDSEYFEEVPSQG